MSKRQKKPRWYHCGFCANGSISANRVNFHMRTEHHFGYPIAFKAVSVRGNRFYSLGMNGAKRQLLRKNKWTKSKLGFSVGITPSNARQVIRFANMRKKNPIENMTIIPVMYHGLMTGNRWRLQVEQIKPLIPQNPSWKEHLGGIER